MSRKDEAKSKGNSQPPYRKKIGNYFLLEMIGKGSFSEVYKANKEPEPNTFYAIKMISKSGLGSEKPEGTDKEMEILRSLNHPHIIKLLDIKQTSNNYYLIFEYCAQGDLDSYMKKYFKDPKTGVARLSEELTLKIYHQIVAAFKLLRKRKIVHRDLKLANILISEDFIIKIADFGFAKAESSNHLLESFCGTPMTMAPEILNRRSYSDKCDIWSLGVILYKLLVGTYPFPPPPGADMFALIKNIEVGKLEFPKDVELSDIVKDLIAGMLKVDPDKRIGFKEFFEHPWFYIPSPSESNLSISDNIYNQSVKDVQLAFKTAFRNINDGKQIKPAAMFEIIEPIRKEKNAVQPLEEADKKLICNFFANLKMNISQKVKRFYSLIIEGFEDLYKYLNLMETYFANLSAFSLAIYTINSLKDLLQAELKFLPLESFKGEHLPLKVSLEAILGDNSELKKEMMIKAREILSRIEQTESNFYDESFEESVSFQLYKNLLELADQAIVNEYSLDETQLMDQYSYLLRLFDWEKFCHFEKYYEIVLSGEDFNKDFYGKIFTYGQGILSQYKFNEDPNTSLMVECQPRPSQDKKGLVEELDVNLVEDIDYLKKMIEERLSQLKSKK